MKKGLSGSDISGLAIKLKPNEYVTITFGDQVMKVKSAGPTNSHLVFQGPKEIRVERATRDHSRIDPNWDLQI